MPIVFKRDLRLYRLKRNLLLPEDKADKIVDVLKRCIVLCSTKIQTAHIALFNRLNFYSKREIDDILFKTKLAGRFQGLRGKAILIPREDFELLYSAYFRQREYKQSEKMKLWNVADADYSAMARMILNNLSKGETSYEELLEAIPVGSRAPVEIIHGNRTRSSTLFDIVFPILLDKWQVIYGRDTWNSKGNRFCLFDYFHPSQKISGNYAKAEQDLVLRYVDSYGPVREGEIAWWCDLTINRVRRILKSDDIAPLIKEIELLHENHYILSDNYEELESFESGYPESYLLLGADDPLMTGYPPGNLPVAEKHRDTVIRKSGSIQPVILINGEVVGTWKFRETKSTIHLSINLFHNIHAKKETKLFRAIERTGEFLGGEEKSAQVEIRYN